MSIVVGIHYKEDGKDKDHKFSLYAIASDSQTTRDGIYVGDDKKIHNINGAFVGSTGWLTQEQIFLKLYRDNVTLSEHGELSTDQILGLWKKAKDDYDYDYEKRDFVALVVNATGLWCVENTFGVAAGKHIPLIEGDRGTLQVATIGHAQDIALGVIWRDLQYYSQGDFDRGALGLVRDIAKRAVKSSIKLSTGCGGNIQWLAGMSE